MFREMVGGIALQEGDIVLTRCCMWLNLEGNADVCRRRSRRGVVVMHMSVESIDHASASFL